MRVLRFPKSAAEATNLAEYRQFVRQLSQTQVGLLAGGLKQSRVSAIETGRAVPQPKNWPALMRAYQLNQDDFLRLILNKQKELEVENQSAALRKPISETEPLIAMAMADETADLYELQPARKVCAG